ncbi:hypothetical protein H0H92_004573 [Tricholoma furcatifolium]|nr:hypothetical protein H0H92_004573 [Tricholoma furcatifolium]
MVTYSIFGDRFHNPLFDDNAFAHAKRPKSDGPSSGQTSTSHDPPFNDPESYRDSQEFKLGLLYYQGKSEEEALRLCQEITRAKKLPINVFDAEYTLGSLGQLNGAFYFTSDEAEEKEPSELIPRDVLRELRATLDFCISIDFIRIHLEPIESSVSRVTPKQQLATLPEGAGLQLQLRSKPSDMMEDLIERVQATLKDKQEYRKLLECRDAQAQELLNMFQRASILPRDALKSYAPLSFRRNLIVATQRLAAASELYPVSYELSSITTLELPECSGGFADVYKGDFQGFPVCVKTIRLHKAIEMHHFMKVVSREAVLWQQLRHPNLVPFYGIYRYRGRISLVSPWMAYGNIEEYLQCQSTSNRVVLAYDVAQGLEFLHENKIIHGDLKGKNILVDDCGRACVADFGLSAVSDNEILAWTSCSSAASKGGSLRWQAPELFDLENGEERRNTMESDIYAWACVAYEIFAGKVPFAHLNREAAIMNYVSKGGQPTRPPASAASWNVWGLTEDIWALMQMCWAPQPPARPLVQDVVNYLSSSLPPGHKTAGDQALSTGQFREMLRDRVDDVEMTTQRFESLLHGSRANVLGSTSTCYAQNRRGSVR